MESIAESLMSRYGLKNPVRGKEVSPKMNLLLYSPTRDAVGERLQRVVEAFVFPDEIKVCRTLQDLSAALRRPNHHLATAVLLATTNEDLTGFLNIRDLLDNLRVILVLPDRHDETVTKAHGLRPRFLAYADGDFIDVAAVLNRMRARAHSEGGDKRHFYAPSYTA
jgi:hypothetical protein